MKLRIPLVSVAAVVAALLLSSTASAIDPPAEGAAAPVLRAKTFEGKPFDLAERKGKWTVVYFYPKADTPGCTKQACTFRDSIEAIRAQGAEVFGVSADDVDAVKAFHEKYHLNFPLLADPKAEAIYAWGVKRTGVSMAKRWTFVVDPALKVRKVFQDVDPVADAKNVAEALKAMGASKG